MMAETPDWEPYQLNTLPFPYRMERPVNSTVFTLTMLTGPYGVLLPKGAFRHQNASVLVEDPSSIYLATTRNIVRHFYQERGSRQVDAIGTFIAFGEPPAVRLERAIEMDLEIIYAFTKMFAVSAQEIGDPLEIEVTKKFMTFRSVEAIYGYSHQREDRFIVIFRSEQNDEQLLLSLIETEMLVRESHSERLISVEFIPTNVRREDLMNPLAKLLFERSRE